MQSLYRIHFCSAIEGNKIQNNRRCQVTTSSTHQCSAIVHSSTTVQMKRRILTMKVPTALVAGLLAIGPMANAQSTCSSDASVIGFSTIAALNTAMQAELSAIENGKSPEESYEFILCPETTFDATNGPLRPVLSGASFECGSNGSSENSCFMEGGSQQILIEDSTVPSYPIETLLFTGITFGGFDSNAFESGTSVYAAASSTTTATFQDCIWLVSMQFMVSISHS